MGDVVQEHAATGVCRSGGCSNETTGGARYCADHGGRSAGPTRPSASPEAPLHQVSVPVAQAWAVAMVGLLFLVIGLVVAHQAVTRGQWWFGWILVGTGSAGLMVGLVVWGVVLGMRVHDGARS